MAKKSVAKKKAAPATKTSKKKAPAKRKDEQIEIMLDPIEKEALDLVQNSDPLCDDLEMAVTAAVAKTVGTVFKKHKIKLTPAQAENVALLLFGN